MQKKPKNQYAELVRSRTYRPKVIQSKKLYNRKKEKIISSNAAAQIKEGKTMLSRSDMVEPTKNLRDIKRTKRAADQFVKETLREGFNKGSKDTVGKKKKKKFPDLTGDGKVTFADVLKGRGVINGKKKKKKVI